MDMLTWMRHALFAVGILTLGLALPVHAATITWTGGGNGTSWNDAANWGGAKPGTNDEAVFNTTGTANKTITLDAPQTVGQLTIYGDPTSLVIGSAADVSAGNTLTLAVLFRTYYPHGGPTIVVDMVVMPGHSSLTATLDGGGTLTLTGNVSGAGKTLEVNGAGVLILSGNNNFGAVTLNGGALQMNSPNAIGTAPVTFNGGILQTFDSTDLSARFSQAPNQGYNVANTGNITFATALASSGGRLGKSSTGKLTLSAANSYSGATTLSAGILTFSGAGSLGSTTAPLYLAGGTLDLGSASPLTVGTVYLSGGATVTNGVLNGAFYSAYPSGAAYVPAILAGGSAGLTKWRSGNSLYLRNANSFAGDTTVNGDTLYLDFANTLVTADILNASSALKLGGGTLSLAGKATTRNNGQTVNGLALNPGASSLAIVSGASSNYTRLTLGVISRTPGGVVNFAPPTGNTVISATNGYVTSTGNDASGILGGYATFGSTPTDWAVNNGTTIVAYAGYATLAGNTPSIPDGVTNNVRISNASTGDVGQAVGTVTVNTLLAKDTTNRTITIGAGNILRLGATGGIFTPSGTGPLTIGAAGNAGTLTAGGADNTPGEVVFNNATTVTNNAVIADNGNGAVTLSKSGAGNLVLSATNSYTGGTIVNAGVLTCASIGALAATTTANNTTVKVGSTNGLMVGLTLTGANVPTGCFISAIPNSTNLTISVNATGNGATTLAYYAGGMTNPLSSTNSMTLGGGTWALGFGGTQAVAGTVAFLGGLLSDGFLTKLGGNYDGQAGTVTASLGGSAGLVKTTPGTLTLTGPNPNTYTGDTVVTEGTLVAGVSGIGRIFIPGNLIVGSPNGVVPVRYSVPQNAVAFNSSKTLTVYTNGTADLGNGNQYVGSSSAKVYLYGGTMLGNYIYSGGGDINMTGGKIASNDSGRHNIYGTSFNLYTTNCDVTAVLDLGLQYTHTLTVADGPAPVDLLFSGGMFGPAKVIKAGSGLMVMSAASTASNLVINGGTVLVNNNSGSGTGAAAVTNAAGTTLGGVGFIGGVAGYSNANVVIQDGTAATTNTTLAPGTIDPATGVHVLGTLTIGSSVQTNSIAFGKFTRLYVQLGAAPGSNDCLAVNGKINLGTASNTNYLDVGFLSGTPKSGDYTIATFNVLTGRFFAVRAAAGTTLPRNSKVSYPGMATGNGNELINGSIVFSIPGSGSALLVR